jgi:hypothetical protein
VTDPTDRSTTVTDPHQSATAPGTDQESIERRSAIAEALGKEVWPADRDALVAKAQDGDVADRVLADLRRLPAGQEFTNVQEVAEVLGLGTEQQRF